MKGLITAAGNNHQHLPLQTVTGPEGYPKPLLLRQIEDFLAAGIERIGIVIKPGDQALFEAAAGDLAKVVTFIPQTEPRGFADAVSRARAFVGADTFLLTVGDHIFVSDDPSHNCLAQVAEAARMVDGPLSAVQATDESLITRFGTVAGEWLEGSERLLKVKRVAEKPTPTVAEQSLHSPGLRHGKYFCYFGIHHLTPDIFGYIDGALTDNATSRATLTDAFQSLLNAQPYHAFVVRGRRFDLESPFGLLESQIASALQSPRRDHVLGRLLHLVAESCPAPADEQRPTPGAPA